MFVVAQVNLLIQLACGSCMLFDEVNPKSSLCRFQPNKPAATNDDAGLIAIAQSCEKIAGSLINLIDTFKVEPGKFRRLRSLGQAVKAAWKKDEVEQLETALRSYQRQLDTRIIVSLR